jgi:hypothetical protein
MRRPVEGAVLDRRDRPCVVLTCECELDTATFPNGNACIERGERLDGDPLRFAERA